MAGGPGREDTARIEFYADPFPDNPALDASMRRLENALSFSNFTADIIPAERDTYRIGSAEKPLKDVTSRGLTVDGTSTVRQGVMSVRDRGVIEFATNSSLVIIPVYTSGSSPFDLWHPASGYLRNGAIWLQTP